MTTQAEQLHQCVQTLAAVCDGALSIDGHGFNGGDAEFGHSLSKRPPEMWTPKQVAAAHKMLGKYRGQLEGRGIDFAAIPVPVEAPEAELPALAAVLEGLAWSAVKAVSTKRGERKVRTATPTQDFWALWKDQGGVLKAAGYGVSKYQGTWQVTHWLTAEGQTIQTEAPEAPQAPAAPTVEESSIEIPEEIAAKLLAHQPASVRRLASAIQSFGAAVDASDLGTGKTYSALAVAKLLGLRPGVICPKAVIPSWRRAAQHIGIELQFAINYEMLRRGTTPLGQWVVSEGKKKEIFRWSVDPADSLLIYDEAQKCKTHGSKNTATGLGALAQGFKVLAMSGTIAQNPLEMRFVGEICRLHKGKDFYPWMLRNGVAKGRFGLQFHGGAKEMADIHRQIYPAHGSRVRIADIPDFPECQTDAEAYDCNGNGAQIQGVYDTMFSELAALQAREDLSPGARQGHVLAIMTFARQRAELLKVPAMCEMAEDYLENGRSVVIFTNFQETMKSLCEKLKTNCVVRGGQSDDERQANVDAFQADRERVIIVNIQSGGSGVSLHDLNGTFPRVAIISPTWSALDLKQATGRIHRAGGKSKAIQRVFFAAGTIEEKVCERVRAKIKNIASLNDGDLAPGGLF